MTRRVLKVCRESGCGGVPNQVHGYCGDCVDEWARESRLEQGLSEWIDDPVFLDQLAASYIATLAVASSSDSGASRRGAVESEEHGAAGPRARSVPGKAQADSPSRRLPGRSTHEQRATARTVALQDNAG